MADYIPNTAQQQQEMLQAIGLRSLEDLFADIPDSIRVQGPLDLPPPLSELELSARLRELASENGSLDKLCCFLGAGAYDHYTPAVVKNLTSRQEFYTAYTPYQPEISQGTLQAIFEFQSMICASPVWIWPTRRFTTAPPPWRRPP
jgi:glycine dehydrogenase subunit 1